MVLTVDTKDLRRWFLLFKLLCSGSIDTWKREREKQASHPTSHSDRKLDNTHPNYNTEEIQSKSSLAIF